MGKTFYLKPGTVLHKQYRIERPLASGGFGEVYEAFDLLLECKVAIKRVFAQLSSELLRREVTILVTHTRKLSFIPNVYNHWEDDGEAGYFIVMDFVEGTALNETHPIPWEHDKVTEFLRIMLRNLHDLHRQGIIHCDIKPVNIKETPPSELFSHVPYMLLDFGIAKRGNETTIRAYSPEYAAPEQYLEFRSMRPDLRIDPRTDLYSLAATVYFLLTGHIIVDTKQRFVHALVGKDDTPVTSQATEIVARIPQGLKETIFAMMNVFPEDRPQDALAALNILEQKLGEDRPPVIEKIAVPAPILPIEPVAPLEDEPKPAILPALPTSWDEPVPPIPPQSEKRDDKPLVDQQPEHSDNQQAAIAGAKLQPTVVIDHCDIHSLALYRDGRTLATAGHSLHVWRVENDALLSEAMIGMSSAQVRALAIHPDGQLIAVVDEAMVHLRRVTDGEVLHSEHVHPGQARGLTFSASGQQVMVIETDAIAIYDAHTLAPSARVVLGDARTIDHIAVSKDGSRVAFHSQTLITVRSLETGDTYCTVPLPAGQDATAIALSTDGSWLAIATFDDISIWNLRDSRADLIDRRQLRDQRSVHLLEFSADTTTLVSLHHSDVQLWRIGDTHIDHEATLRHAARIRDVSISPDNKSVITAAADATLQLWRLPD